MREFATGRRTYFHDGPYYTVVSDMAVSGGRLYIAQLSGNNGNVVRADLDLSNSSYFFIDSGGNPGHPVLALDAQLGRLVLGETFDGQSKILVVDTTGVLLTQRLLAPSPVQDIGWRADGAGILVAHGAFASWYTFPDLLFDGTMLLGGGETPGSLVRLSNTTGSDWLIGFRGGVHPGIYKVADLSAVLNAQRLGFDCGALSLNPLNNNVLATNLGASRFDLFPLDPALPGVPLGAGANPRTVMAYGTSYYLADLHGVRQVEYQEPPPPDPGGDPEPEGERQFGPRRARLGISSLRPSGNGLVLLATLPEPGTLRTELFDLSGRRLAIDTRYVSRAGEVRLVLEASALRPGLILARIQLGDHTANRRLVLLR